MNPKLVLLTGLPGSGKSTIREYVENELKYPCFSIDSLALSRYDSRFNKVLISRLSNQERRKLMDDFKSSYMDAVRQGKNTVVEDASPTNRKRLWLLDTNSIDADKYLVLLRVDENVRKFRLGERYDLNWASGGWEEASEDLKGSCTILEYTNNTQEDLRKIEDEFRSLLTRH